MSWRDPDDRSPDDPMRRFGRPGGDWQGLRPSFDNPLSWSVPLGRVLGIAIRIHAFFLIYIVVVLLMARFPRAGAAGPLTVGVAAVAMGLLFAIVLLHEIGHCLACRWARGEADEILMWPLGGLAYCRPPNEWKPHLVTVVGGPLVNVWIALLITPTLGLLTGRWVGVAIPNPFDFGGLYVEAITRSWPLMVLYLAGQLNAIILLFNLLPIFPLDGGRMVQAVLWSRIGYVRSMRMAVRVGYVGAIGLGIFGLVMGHWMLVFIAFFGGVTCYVTHRQLQFTQEMMGFESDDYAAGVYGPTEEAGESTSAGEVRRQRRAERRARRRAAEQQSLDAILRKISESGIESLSRAEKRRLHRATEQKQQSPPS